MKKDRLRLIIARALYLMPRDPYPSGPEDLGAHCTASCRDALPGLSTVRPRGW